MFSLESPAAVGFSSLHQPGMPHRGLGRGCWGVTDLPRQHGPEVGARGCVCACAGVFPLPSVPRVHGAGGPAVPVVLFRAFRAVRLCLLWRVSQASWAGGSLHFCRREMRGGHVPAWLGWSWTADPCTPLIL